MSNGSNSSNGEWKMPEPVFRSSEGKTPKSAKTSDQEDIDTESPDFAEADTDEFDTDPVDQDEVDTETPDPDAEEEDTKEFPVASADEPKPQVRAAEKPAKTAGGCAKTMLMMVGITTFAIIAIVAVLIYFLFYYTPANTTF